MLAAKHISEVKLKQPSWYLFGSFEDVAPKILIKRLKLKNNIYICIKIAV